MKFICPSCKHCITINESFLGKKGTLIICPECKNRFHILSGKTSNQNFHNRWIVRKKNGTTIKTNSISSLHNLIIQGIVSPSDMLSNNGKTWIKIENVIELSGLFNLAQIEKNEETAKIDKVDTKETTVFNPRIACSESGMLDSETRVWKKSGPAEKQVESQQATTPFYAFKEDESPTTVFPVPLKYRQTGDSRKSLVSSKASVTAIPDETLPIPLKRKRSPQKPEK